MTAFGCQDMVEPIKRILVKHPIDAFINQSKIDQESKKLNYYDKPNFKLACEQYDKFLNIIRSFNSEIHILPQDTNTSLDSIYTHDTCVVTNHGIILCNMSKPDRYSEPYEVAKYFKSIDIPIKGQIQKPGSLEGGDIVWINEHTVAIGEGYRSNAEGIRQFKYIMKGLIDEVISVPLPHWTGSNDCLHLMSNVSPLDKNLFLVYSRLLSVPFRKYLLNQNIKLIEVSDEEYHTMGCNVLAMDRRKVIMIKGNPKTQHKLEKEGVEVSTYDGSEISLKGAGGPTCLTRPFLRSAK